jgi:phosphoribosyl 1,2-cyclic phosphodiesterase
MDTNKKALYFKGLVDFSRFGVKGSGGRANIPRSIASASACASASGRNSSLASSAAISSLVSCFDILNSLRRG